MFQPGAWILPDERPLTPELAVFLDAGEPPVYFGFGSMPVPGDLSRVLVDTARALGRRAVVSRGWAGLSSWTTSPAAWSSARSTSRLFARVAAAVHHGGAGTTTARGPRPSA